MITPAAWAVRPAERRDEPLLKSLWKTVFGDSDQEIDLFFTTYFSPEWTAVINDGEQLIASAYILPVGTLNLPDGKRQNCAMLYAIATLPAYRSRGCGTAVTQSAAEQAKRLGIDAVVLKPVNDGLFDFYENQTGFKPFFEAFEASFTADALTKPKTQYELSPLLPESYQTARRSVLNGSVYIDMDRHGLSYQHQLCTASDGGMYAIRYHDGIIGCAAVECDDNTVYIKELLLSTSQHLSDAVSAIAERHPAVQYIVRHPFDDGSLQQNTRRAFGMILPASEIIDEYIGQTAKWYGPAFD